MNAGDILDEAELVRATERFIKLGNLMTNLQSFQLAS